MITTGLSRAAWLHATSRIQPRTQMYMLVDYFEYEDIKVSGKSGHTRHSGAGVSTGVLDHLATGF